MCVCVLGGCRSAKQNLLPSEVRSIQASPDTPSLSTCHTHSSMCVCSLGHFLRHALPTPAHSTCAPSWAGRRKPDGCKPLQCTSSSGSACGAATACGLSACAASLRRRPRYCAAPSQASRHPPRQGRTGTSTRRAAAAVPATPGVRERETPAATSPRPQMGWPRPRWP